MTTETNWKAQPDDPDYDRMREELVLAAIEIISRDGVEGLKTQSLATQAGIKRSTYYRYFSSKDELIVAVLEHEFNALVDDAARLTSHLEDPIDRVIESVYQTLLAHRTNKRLSNLLGPESKNCIKLNTLAQFIYPKLITPLLIANFSDGELSQEEAKNYDYIVRWLLNTVLAMAMFGTGGLDEADEKGMLQLNVRPVLESLVET